MSSALGRSLSASQLDASQRRSRTPSQSQSHAAIQNAASTKRLMSILQNRPVGMKEIKQQQRSTHVVVPAATSSPPAAAAVAASPFASSVRPRAATTSHDILTSFRQELERVRYDVNERWRRTEQLIEDAMRKTTTQSHARATQPVKQTTTSTSTVDADAINFIPLLEPVRSSASRLPPNPFFLPLSSTSPFRRHTRQPVASSSSSSFTLDDDVDLADLHARGSSLLRRHQLHSHELAQSRLHSLLEQLHTLKSTHNSALDSELDEIEVKYAHDARKLQEEYERSKHALRTKALQQAEVTQLKFTENVQQHVNQLHDTLEKELSVNSPSSAATTIRQPPSTAARHSSPLGFDSSLRLEHLDAHGIANNYSSYRRPRSRAQQHPSPSRADLRSADLYDPAITDLLHSSEDDEAEDDEEQLKQKLIAQAAYLQRARASIRRPLSSPFRPSASSSSHRRSSPPSSRSGSSSWSRSHRSHQQHHPRSAASLLIVTSSEEDEEENAQSLLRTTSAATDQQHRPASSPSSSSRTPVESQNRRSHLFDSGDDEDDIDAQSTMRRSTSHRYSPIRPAPSSNLSSSHSSLKDLARRLHSRIASIQKRS